MDAISDLLTASIVAIGREQGDPCSGPEGPSGLRGGASWKPGIDRGRVVGGSAAGERVHTRAAVAVVDTGTSDQRVVAFTAPEHIGA